MAAGDAIYFGRCYELELNGEVFATTQGSPAMDIKFDVTYARGQTAKEGTLSILGLGWDKIHEFLALAAVTRGEAMSEMMTVKLRAGYYTAAGMVDIFDGFAWYATVTSPPQMWLNLKVCEYNPKGGRTKVIQQNEAMKLDAWGEFIAREFSEEGYELEFCDNTHDQLCSTESEKKFDFGQEAKTLQEVISILDTSGSGNIGFILRSSCGERRIEAVDKGYFVATDGEITVDKDNGLLSVTGIDAVNGCITTFLDGRNQDDLTYLNLKSELNPQADGRYIIVKIQHTGHFLGQEWYTKYFCSAREDEKEENG